MRETGLKLGASLLPDTTGVLCASSTEAIIRGSLSLEDFCGRIVSF